MSISFKTKHVAISAGILAIAVTVLSGCSADTFRRTWSSERSFCGMSDQELAKKKYDQLLVSGYTAMEKGDAMCAEKLFKAAQIANPNEPFAALNAGVALQQLKKYPEAREAYFKAMEIEHNTGGSTTKTGETATSLAKKYVGTLPGTLGADGRAPGAPALKPLEVTVVAQGLFDFGGAAGAMNAQAKSKLETELKAAVGQFQNIERIRVTGHVDPVGVRANMVPLSETRAKAVAKMITDAGMFTGTIETIGAGDSKLVVAKCPQAPRAARSQCNAPNRRVEVQIAGMAKP
jgi:outer membrane protein OmpA-like peptidoglycan-associated protein